MWRVLMIISFPFLEKHLYERYYCSHGRLYIWFWSGDFRERKRRRDQRVQGFLPVSAFTYRLCARRRYTGSLTFLLFAFVNVCFARTPPSVRARFMRRQRAWKMQKRLCDKCISTLASSPFYDTLSFSRFDIAYFSTSAQLILNSREAVQFPRNADAPLQRPTASDTFIDCSSFSTKTVNSAMIVPDGYRFA